MILLLYNKIIILVHRVFLGCACITQVTAISSSPLKEGAAKEIGAEVFLVSTDLAR